MTLLVQGYCGNCRKPVGEVSWDADLLRCKVCAKAEDVYAPPGGWMTYRARRTFRRRAEASQ